MPDPHILVKTPEPTPEIITVSKQPRSIAGDGVWQKVSWHRDPKTGGYVATREPTERPPQGRVQVIPGADGLSTEALNYILGEATQRQEYARRKREAISDEDIAAMAEKMWQDFNNRFHDHIGAKTAFLQGKTVSGPSGLHQREKPGIQDWTGVTPR